MLLRAFNCTYWPWVSQSFCLIGVVALFTLIVACWINFFFLMVAHGGCCKKKEQTNRKSWTRDSNLDKGRVCERLQCACEEICTSSCLHLLFNFICTTTCSSIEHVVILMVPSSYKRLLVLVVLINPMVIMSKCDDLLVMSKRLWLSTSNVQSCIIVRTLGLLMIMSKHKMGTKYLNAVRGTG